MDVDGKNDNHAKGLGDSTNCQLHLASDLAITDSLPIQGFRGRTYYTGSVVQSQGKVHVGLGQLHVEEPIINYSSCMGYCGLYKLCSIIEAIVCMVL